MFHKHISLSTATTGYYQTTAHKGSPLIKQFTRLNYVLYIQTENIRLKRHFNKTDTAMSRLYRLIPLRNQFNCRQGRGFHRYPICKAKGSQIGGNTIPSRHDNSIHTDGQDIHYCHRYVINTLYPTSLKRNRPSRGPA